ncbi:hypothetical protein CapIbe_012819 [Capra ibex]
MAKDEKMLGTQCCCLVAMVTTAYYPALSFIKKELHLTEREENACSLQQRRKEVLFSSMSVKVMREKLDNYEHHELVKSQHLA